MFVFSHFQVDITITDLNDITPQFLDEPYFATADASCVEEGFLIDIEAFDQDQGVSVEQDILNRETTVTIVARDDGSPSLSAKASIIIAVV